MEHPTQHMLIEIGGQLVFMLGILCINVVVGAFVMHQIKKWRNKR